VVGSTTKVAKMALVTVIRIILLNVAKRLYRRIEISAAAFENAAT
jgi:hypothetical protein